MNGSGVRADFLLSSLGMGRERAKSLIEAGRVFTASGRNIRKASEKVDANEVLSVQAADDDVWVSRAVGKLIPSLDEFAPDLSGKTGLDIGASTGGFTQLMLARGAKRVYAVDCGHGQLHESLASDSRVVSLEKTNARTLTQAQIPDPVDILTMDVSFISVTLIIPALVGLLSPGAMIFILIKPQFEAGREHLNKKGVVTDSVTRSLCNRNVCGFIANHTPWDFVALRESPVPGPEGNIETVAVFRRGEHANFG